jgi:hypothetical protein
MLLPYVLRDSPPPPIYDSVAIIISNGRTNNEAVSAASCCCCPNNSAYRCIHLLHNLSLDTPQHSVSAGCLLPTRGLMLAVKCPLAHTAVFSTLKSEAIDINLGGGGYQPTAWYVLRCVQMYPGFEQCSLAWVLREGIC